MSKTNKLIIAAAGSGKTTHLVNEALKSQGSVLITTYTLENEAEIKTRFIELNRCIPKNVTIQTWFSFLIQHGIKPYQGCVNEQLFDKQIKGLLLTQEQSGVKYRNKLNNQPVMYAEDTEFLKHYFTKDTKVFSDKLSKLACRCNEKSDGEVVSRISRIFDNVFVDEVQDLAGYDLEIIKLLFESNSNILLVGDPRQVTYLTNHYKKYDKYKDGKIKEFILSECKKSNVVIDETTLNVSHRNNKAICEFSAQLYPDYPEIKPCTCCHNVVSAHTGIHIINRNEVDEYIKNHNPIQLRWDKKKMVTHTLPVFNFGESKGKTFDNVIIYPTEDMGKWIKNKKQKLSNAARAKFYVAITRARFSVAIVVEQQEVR